MIRYQYKALELNGKKASGVIEATDEYTAVLQIKENYPILLEIRPMKQKEGILSKEIGKTAINYKDFRLCVPSFLRFFVPEFQLMLAYLLLQSRTKIKN